MWSGVPTSWRPVYGVSMLAAALGYLAMVAYVQRTESSFSTGTWQAIHLSLLLILIPSAIWLPATLLYASDPSFGGWWLIRVVLGLVALGSLWLLLTIWYSQSGSSLSYLLAVIGMGLFAFHTVILDGALWPAKFPQLH